MVDCTKSIAESNNFIILDRYQWDYPVAESYQSEDALERELIDDLVNQGYEYARDKPGRERLLRAQKIAPAFSVYTPSLTITAPGPFLPASG